MADDKKLGAVQSPIPQPKVVDKNTPQIVVPKIVPQMPTDPNAIIIQNHNRPVDRAVGGKEETAQDEGVADIEQRTAQGDQLALERMACQPADRTGCRD